MTSSDRGTEAPSERGFAGAGYFAQSCDHGGHARIIKPEPVEQGGGEAHLCRDFHVARVGFPDVVAILFQRLGHGQEALVLFGSGQASQLTRRRPGLSGQLRHLFRQRHALRLSQNGRVKRRKLAFRELRANQKTRSCPFVFVHG